MLGSGKISAEDLDLLLVTDDPAEATAHIVDRHQAHLSDRVSSSGAAKQG